MTPAAYISLAIFVAVISTSIWGYIEARRIYPAGQAIAWGFGFVLFWIVVFPIFLVSRSRRLAQLGTEQPSVTAHQMGPPPSSRPPGWYADPWRQGSVRWWDGFQWSDQFR